MAAQHSTGDDDADGALDYALVIGIGAYAELGEVAGAAEDAQAFRDWLVAAEGGGVPEENVRVLNDAAVTAEALVSAFGGFAHDVASADPARRVYLFAAGLGMHSDGGVALLPGDISGTRPTAIPLVSWMDEVAGLGICEEIVLVADLGHAPLPAPLELLPFSFDVQARSTEEADPPRLYLISLADGDLAEAPPSEHAYVA